MRLICEKNSFYEALNHVSKAVATKSTITSLEGVKIKIENNTMDLTGYDLEIGIQTQIPITSSDTGEFIVNSKLINDIVRKMPNDQIEITVSDSLSVTIKSGLTEYTISATNSEEYPDIPKISESESFSLPQSLLKSMIQQTIFAVATNDAKPILTGELFELADNNLNIVAIDGYRLAIRTEKVNIDKEMKFVVPSKALNEVSRLLSDDDEKECTVNVSKKHIIFDISGYFVISRLLEGEFHNYKNSLPPSFNTEVIVDTKEMINSLDRASLLINERIKSPIKLVFENNQILTSCNTTLGKISDEINCELIGNSIEIGFNNKYLLDPLKAIDDDKVKFLLNGSNLPMKIVPLTGDFYTYLVLPVRLKND